MHFQAGKPSKILNVLMWLSIVPTLLGQVFKVMHYPAAALLLMIGTFVFGFFYLPLFVVESWKTKENKRQKVVLFVQGLILFFFSVGFLFKIMNWPGSGVFYLFNNGILVIIVIPYALYHLLVNSKSSLVKSHNLLLVMYFFCHSLGSLMNSGSGRIKIDTVLQQGLNTEQALKAANSRNRQLYASIQGASADNGSGLLLKINHLKAITDSANQHIQRLKTHLVAVGDNIPEAKADTMSSINILDAVNLDVPTGILIGNEFNPNKDKYSAAQLKTVLNSCRDSLLNLVAEQNRSIIKEGLNLNTDNYTDENGEPVSWEMTHFNNMPLLYVFNTLTNLQYEIKNAEYQVLTDIINSGDKNLNTALFSRISELNTKYSAIKEREEILKLQKENAKGMELLNAKDSELSDTRQSIIYFVLVILVFFVLVFFVIRSNYLRKQANKVLKQQKEITKPNSSKINR